MAAGAMEWEAVNINPKAAEELATRTSKHLEEITDRLQDAQKWASELGDAPGGGSLAEAVAAAKAAFKPCLDTCFMLQPGAALSFRQRLQPLRARRSVTAGVRLLNTLSGKATEAVAHAGTVILGAQGLRLAGQAGLAQLRRERCQHGGRLAAEVRARREAQRDSAFAQVVVEVRREDGTLFRRLAAALARNARGPEKGGSVKALNFANGLLHRALEHEKGQLSDTETADYVVKWVKQYADVLEDFVEQCCLPAEKALEEMGLVGRDCLSAAGTELCVGNLRLARDFALEGLKMQRQSEQSMSLQRASGRMHKQRFERFLAVMLGGLPKVYGGLTSSFAELGDGRLLYKLGPEVANTILFVRVSAIEARLDRFVVQQEAAAEAFRTQQAEKMAEALRRLDGLDDQVDDLWTAVRIITPHMPLAGQQQLRQLADRAQQAREAIPCRLQAHAQRDAQPRYLPAIRTVDSAADMQMG